MNDGELTRTLRGGDTFGEVIEGIEEEEPNVYWPRSFFFLLLSIPYIFSDFRTILGLSSVFCLPLKSTFLSTLIVLFWKNAQAVGVGLVEGVVMGLWLAEFWVLMLLEPAKSCLLTL